MMVHVMPKEVPTVDMTLAQWRLADLVMYYPGATAILFKHQLDFCKEGQTTLADAALANHLDVETLISTLTTHHMHLEHSDVSHSESVETIPQLLYRYHQRHRQRFPELIRLAERVELDNVHHFACPKGLALLLMDMQFSWEIHMQKTEQLLLSSPRLATDHPALAYLSEMRQHDSLHQAQLQQLRQLSHQYSPPCDASITWCALYKNLQWLQTDLQQQLALEHAILDAQREPS